MAVMISFSSEALSISESIGNLRHFIDAKSTSPELPANVQISAEKPKIYTITGI
jgi:hypothetical protein